MNERVLITGSSGYLGTELTDRLGRAGCEVYGMGRRGSASPRHIQCDLLDADATRAAFRELPPLRAVVHTAGRAGGDHERILENLIAALRERPTRLIYLSSVAVYGDADRLGPVGVDADLRPATAYGRSKLACEGLLERSGLPDRRILRLTPAYSNWNVRNLLVRTCLPGTRLRVRIYPRPKHSVCSAATLAAVVLWHIRDGAPGAWVVENVADPEVRDLDELARLAHLRGPALPVFAACFRPLEWGLRRLPGGTAYALRCALWKYLHSNVFEIPHRQYERQG